MRNPRESWCDITHVTSLYDDININNWYIGTHDTTGLANSGIDGNKRISE